MCTLKDSSNSYLMHFIVSLCIFVQVVILCLQHYYQDRFLWLCGSWLLHWFCSGQFSNLIFPLSPAQSPASAPTALWSPWCCLLYPVSPGSPLAMPKPPGGSPQRPGFPDSLAASPWLPSAGPGAPSGAGLSLWPLLLTPVLLQTETGPPGRHARLSP